MSTFGCHSCGVKIEDLKDKPYEEWPCAHCSLSKDYSKTFNTGYFDTKVLEEVEDEDQAIKLEPEDSDFITVGEIPLRPEELRTLKTIKNAVMHHMCSLFTGAIMKLVRIASKKPAVFEVVVKKMQFPYMSYSEIGASMNPPCSKQNVLYYLKQAVTEIPQLADVLLVDTRYSSGYYALKTVADIKRQKEAEKEIQKNIFGKQAQDLAMSIEEVNSILHLPFNFKDEIINFNAYIKDEDYLNGTAED